MSNRLLRACVCGLICLSILEIIIPCSLQAFLPVSSGVCITPNPANQIKSIQIMPVSKRGFYPAYLLPTLKPAMIRVHINPYYCPDSVPVFFVDCRSKMMELNKDFVKNERGDFTTPFSEEALMSFLGDYSAKHSPQRGTIHTKEVFSVLSSLCDTDIRRNPALPELAHYSISYVHPYPFTAVSFFSPIGWMLAFFAGLSAYRKSGRKHAE